VKSVLVRDMDLLI